MEISNPLINGALLVILIPPHIPHDSSYHNRPNRQKEANSANDAEWW